MHISMFLSGVVVSSLIVVASCLWAGSSLLMSVGMGLLTAMLAQLLYLMLVAYLARREAILRHRPSAYGADGSASPKNGNPDQLAP